MTKILFICHGNICRSPTAEFVMKDIVKKAGMEGEFDIASAATSCDELGSGVYPPSRKLLAAHGIDCAGKTARRMRHDDYDYYDLIIGMDEENLRELRRFYSGDPDGKIHNLLDYAGREGEEVDDPWYTRDFQRAWDDIYAGCRGLFDALGGVTTLDFTACESREALYAVMRRAMDWQDWYGENLDALWDILTGLPHAGRRYKLLLPGEGVEAAVREYAERIEGIFRRAGALAE